MKTLHFIVVFLISTNLFCQNIIPNPGFEIIADCPTGSGQLYLLESWQSVAGMTPDLLHTCATDGGGPVTGASVPSSRLGYQLPRNGEAYVGISAYKFNQVTATSSGYEYIETALNSSTEKGVSYFIEFYVSPNDRISNFGLGYSDGLGLVLTNERLLTEPIPENLIILEPTIIHKGTVINDTLNWTRIYGSYIATGQEKYATIGNFRPQPETLFEIVDPTNIFRSYYFIEDVAVIPYNPLPDTLLLCQNEALNLDARFIHATDYQWSTGETDGQIEINAGGRYNVTAYVDTVQLFDGVEVIMIEEDNTSWVHDTLICEGNSINLTTPFPGDYNWTTGDTGATISVSEADIYTLSIENECGQYQFSTDIEQINCNCNVFIPNAFSPDDDGINDYLEAYFACPLDYTITNFVVFDRWGNEMYISKGEVKWDGTKNGTDLSTGEYIWFLEYKYFNVRTDSFEDRLEKGSVLIVR